MTNTASPAKKKNAAGGGPAASRRGMGDNSGQRHYTTSRVDVDELLDRISLPDLVERLGQTTLTYVRSKGEYRGKCPLHGGGNPTAFHLSQDSDGRWRWKCWACGKSGNAIGFIKEKQNITDFLEAVRYLAEWGGVPFDDIGLTPEAQKKVQARKARTDILDLAARFAVEQLWSEAGKEALAYARSRGFSDDLIRLAGFGFLDGSTALRDHLTEADADLVLAHKLGIIRKDGRDFTANGNGRKAAPTGWLIYAHRRYPNARRKHCKKCEAETWHAGDTCLKHGATFSHIRKVNYLSARALAPMSPKDKSRNLPGQRQLYKAEVSGVREVIICEGQADAESYRQLGFTAWALCGLGSLPESDLAELRRRPVVYITLDNDEEGQRKQGRLAQAIGPLAMIVPPLDVEGGDIKDANDWLRAGATPEEVTAQLKLSEPWIEQQLDRVRDAQPYELPEITAELVDLLQQLPREAAPRYLQKAGRRLGMSRSELRQLMNEYESDDETGERPILAKIKDNVLTFLGEPLGDFSMWIVKEVRVIDGLNLPEVHFRIQGRTAAGEPLPEVEIPAGEFAEMKWINRYWGASATLYVPRGKYYMVVRAVNEVSRANMVRERVYTHTGWAEIDGKRSFLTVTGRITEKGLDDSVRVELDNALDHYALPEPPRGRALAIATQFSLEFLNLASLRITAPLWAALYAAPLTEVRALYTLLWLYGGTRSGKSTIAHLALTHFGSGFIDGRQYHAPLGWDDTEKHIEECLFAAKDAPVIIDDFAPQFQSARDSRLMHKTAQKVVRAVGNRKARGRSRHYQKNTESPRGMVISTAELPLAGESTTARMIYISVNRGDVLPRPGDPPREALTEAQKLAEDGEYARAMAAYIQWLAANWERAAAMYLEIIEESSRFVQEKDLLQDRLVDYYGILNAGQRLALTAFQELGVISRHEQETLAEANRQAILDVLTSQRARIAAESPVRKFFDALTNLLENRQVYLAPRKQRSMAEPFIPPPNADLVGYYEPDDDGVVYLNPLTCLSQVKAFWRGLGENFDTTPDALLRQFVQIDGLVVRHDKGRTTASVWTPERNQRLLAVDPYKAAEMFGAILKNGSDPAEDFSATNG